MSTELHTTQLQELCSALGWQGGTFHQVIAEVHRLRNTTAEVLDVIDVICAAQQLTRDARRVGAVLTISQRPLLPLAMGHHEDVIETREVRR